ncbi:TPA: winged helix-turn-helix domain-containing protein [Klebsiella aerogenes]|nr:winged helix-turn-helix domain-containing protein [Klebsiella aerogenes]
MITETENGSKNNHNFIINGRVKFIPFRRIIEDMNTGTKIKLHVPASLCLDRLLNNQGRLVSQDELILYAWGLKRESTVSSNTFYQCILHLRRKLAQLELCDVIETVPRHGIIFNNSVSVLITQDTPPVFQLDDEGYQTPEDAAEKDIELLLPVEIDRKQITNEMPSPLSPEKGSDTSLTSTIRMVEKDRLRIRPRYVLFTSAILLILIAVLGFMYITFTNDNVFKSYNQLSYTNCFIYTIDKQYSENEIKNIMKSVGLPCFNKESVFFTVSSMQSKLNIINCATYNKKQQNCRSVTIARELEEKP